ncbi:MAG: hypothetical protein ACOCPX_07930 [Halapricum sp.]
MDVSTARQESVYGDALLPTGEGQSANGALGHVITIASQRDAAVHVL